MSVLAWNFTLDQTKAAGAPTLDREVTVEVAGLTAGSTYRLRHERVDEDHSNIASVWRRIRDEGQAWPTDAQWRRLRDADRLELLDPETTVVAGEDGTLSVRFDLPMPSMSRLSLRLV